jgi:hypothetical protein
LLRLEQGRVVGVVVEELVLDVVLHEQAGDVGEDEVLRQLHRRRISIRVAVVGGRRVLLLVVRRGREVEVGGRRVRDEIGEVEGRVVGGTHGGGGGVAGRVRGDLDL